MSFNIVCYQNTAEPNRVDKTSFLTSVETLKGTLREESSIMTPSIIFQRTTIPTYNYCYISTFNGRYYFIKNIESVANKLWRMDLECDVLMTYKTGILALSAVVGRQEFDYNADLVDPQLPVEKEPDVSFVAIASAAFNNTATTPLDDDSFILTVIGDGDTSPVIPPITP